MKRIPAIFLMLAALVTVSSCATYKKINYLQDVETDVAKAIDNLPAGVLIQPKDKLSIVVSCRNPELAVIYNLPVYSTQAGGETMISGSQQRLLYYMVDNEGCIDFPQIGKIHVAGLTRFELADTIKRLITDIKDAVVTVEFVNFKISVLGEVTQPGSYTIDGDRVTILQAIALARDLTIVGRRDRIFVIREVEGQRTVYKVDLRTKDLFDSPAYYLVQNDIIYVEPNKMQAGKSTINENNVKSVGLWVSIGSFLTTLASFITTVLLVHK